MQPHISSNLFRRSVHQYCDPRRATPVLRICRTWATTLLGMGEPSAVKILSELPVTEFAFPGPLRDRLVDAVLSERKVSTTGLALAYEVEREPLPKPGGRFKVVDSNDHPVAVIEVTSVVVVPLGEVDLAHVVDEGEGYETIHAWRTSHEAFWQSKEMLTLLGDPTFAVEDTTPVVLERFKLVERLI